MDTKVIKNINKEGFAVSQTVKLIKELAKVDLDIIGCDIFYSLVTQIKPEDSNLREYDVSVLDLEKSVGIKFKGNELSLACDKLEAKIEFKNETEDFERYPLFIKMKYISKTRRLVATFNPYLKPHLLELTLDKKNFSSSRFFGTVSKIRSKRIRDLYFLLNQFLKKGYYEFYRVEDFYNFINATETERKFFSQVENRFLRKAVDEINLKTDLQISYRKVKEGRRVVALKFNIKGSTGISEYQRFLDRQSKKDGEIYTSKTTPETEISVEQKETEVIDTEIITTKAQSGTLSKEIFYEGIDLLNDILNKNAKKAKNSLSLELYYEKVMNMTNEDYQRDIKIFVSSIENTSYFPSVNHFMNIKIVKEAYKDQMPTDIFSGNSKNGEIIEIEMKADINIEDLNVNEGSFSLKSFDKVVSYLNKSSEYSFDLKNESLLINCYEVIKNLEGSNVKSKLKNFSFNHPFTGKDDLEMTLEIFREDVLGVKDENDDLLDF